MFGEEAVEDKSTALLFVVNVAVGEVVRFSFGEFLEVSSLVIIGRLFAVEGSDETVVILLLLFFFVCMCFLRGEEIIIRRNIKI